MWYSGSSSSNLASPPVLAYLCGRKYPNRKQKRWKDGAVPKHIRKIYNDIYSMTLPNGFFFFIKIYLPIRKSS